MAVVDRFDSNPEGDDTLDSSIKFFKVLLSNLYVWLVVMFCVRRNLGDPVFENDDWQLIYLETGFESNDPMMSFVLKLKKLGLFGVIGLKAFLFV